MVFVVDYFLSFNVGRLNEENMDFDNVSSLSTGA